jgi:hypothetical protein
VRASNGLGPIYPLDQPKALLAARLCRALHAVAGKQRAACCGGPIASPLLELCESSLSAALATRAVTLDAAAIARCETAVERSFAGCDWVTPGLPPPPPECQGLLRGALGEGSVCRSSLECAGNLHCAGLSPTRTGTCARPRARGVGCGAPVDPLATYTLAHAVERDHPVCQDVCSLTTHRCEPVPAVGDACTARVNCAPDLRCVAGRCSLDAPAGLGERCEGRACAADLRCSGGRCIPKAAVGEACAMDLDCATGGCVPRDDGQKTCGAKCVASLEALTSPAASPALRLPLRARPER